MADSSEVEVLLPSSGSAEVLLHVSRSVDADSDKFANTRGRLTARQATAVLASLVAAAACATLLAGALHVLPTGRAELAAVASVIQDYTFNADLFRCRRITCWDMTSGNCPEDFCSIRAQFSDGRVGRNVELCQEACVKETTCVDFVVQTQSDWQYSACFLLTRRIECGRPVDGTYWGVHCTPYPAPPIVMPHTSTANTTSFESGDRVVEGKWVPQFTIATESEYTFKKGARSVQTSTQAALYRGLSVKVDGVDVRVAGKLGVDYRDTLTQTTAEAFTVKLRPKYDAQFVWQWGYVLKEGDAETRVAMTKEIAITAGRWEVPRCVPAKQQSLRWRARVQSLRPRSTMCAASGMFAARSGSRRSSSARRRARSSLSNPRRPCWSPRAALAKRPLAGLMASWGASTWAPVTSSMGEIIPGMGCDKDLCTEIHEELKKRQQSRGDQGQIQRSEETKGLLLEMKQEQAHMQLKLDSLLNNHGIQIPPKPVVLGAAA